MKTLLKNVLKIFLFYSFFAASHCTATAQTITPEPFGDPQHSELYRFPIGFITEADSVGGGTHSGETLIERVVVVVDTAVVDSDSIVVRMRESQTVLWSSGPIGMETRWAIPGSMFSSSPDASTGAMGDTVVIAVYSGGVPVGHIRIYIFYRRLF